MKPNDGAPYRALEVAVATSDFIAAPRRISLASFHSVGSSRTPEEVWIEGHVSVKWPISRVTITATSRLDKPSKVPVDVRDPERVSFPVTTRTRISSDRHVMFSPFKRTATARDCNIALHTFKATIGTRRRVIVDQSWFVRRTGRRARTLSHSLEIFTAVRHVRRTRTNVAFQISSRISLRVSFEPRTYFQYFQRYIRTSLIQVKFSRREKHASHTGVIAISTMLFP